MIKEILMLLFACVVTNNICVAQGVGVLEVQNPKKNVGYVGLISVSITLIAAATAVGYYYLHNLVLVAFDLEFLKIY